VVWTGRVKRRGKWEARGSELVEPVRSSLARQRLEVLDGCWKGKRLVCSKEGRSESLIMDSKRRSYYYNKSSLVQAPQGYD